MGRIRANLVVAIVILAVMCVWALLRPSPRRMLDDRGPPDSRSAPPVADGSAARPVTGVVRKPASRRRLDPVEPSPVADTRGLFRIVGTVVTHEIRDLVPRAPIRAIAGFDSALPRIALAEAAEDGTFSVDLPAEGVIWVSLNAETPLGAGPVSIDVKPPFEGTRDLGEIELEPFSMLGFKIMTADGTPIADAAVDTSPGGARLARSGPDGIGVLERSNEIRQLRVVARGFGLAEVPVSPGQEMVEVRLSPASSLTIHVMTNDGPPNPDTMKLSIELQLGARFPVEVMPLDPLWGGVGNPVTTEHRGLAISFNHPTVTLSPMRAGSILRVVASESMSRTRETQELIIGAAESRVVTLPLRSVFHRLRGRVVNSGGAPVDGATVLFGIPDFTRTTDEDGTFDFGAVAHKVVDLRVSTKTHAFWESTVVQLEGAPVVLTLEDGVPLRVKVRDVQDQPVKGASVYVCDRFDVTGPEGEVSFQHVPLRSVPIRVFFDGINHEFHHHTAAPEVTVRLEPPK